MARALGAKVRAVFDAKALDDLNEIDPGLAATLLVEFKTLSVKLIGWIEKALADGDLSALEMHSHSLKNNAKTLGFEQLADLCKEIETSALRQQARPECVAQLAAAREAALAAIASKIA